MDDKLIPAILIVIACFVHYVSAQNPPAMNRKCYECNVWKAGYGQLCDNPRIRDDCMFCMKIETTIFMGYYKNTPRSSTIISRVCGKTKIPHFSQECHYNTMADGTSVECYCDDELCNSAPKCQKLSLSGLVAACVLTILLQRWML